MILLIRILQFCIGITMLLASFAITIAVPSHVFFAPIYFFFLSGACLLCSTILWSKIPRTSFVLTILSYFIISFFLILNFIFKLSINKKISGMVYWEVIGIHVVLLLISIVFCTLTYFYLIKIPSKPDVP